ncbi:MAG: hypothetical protein ACJAYU_000552 [Bradymonadia bacterium]|jgi:hypothetical protein
MSSVSVAYANLVGQPSTCGDDYVVPGNSAASSLVQKLMGSTCSGSMMPRGSSWTAGQVQTVVDWVEQGALP